MRRGNDWVEVSIANLSSTGLMVKSTTSPKSGSEVEIRRRGVCIIGEVMWSTPTRFGLRSFEPIDVDALLAESGIQVRKAEIEPSEPRFWHWRKMRD